MKKSIAFITTGYFPIPPTMGGAVESLVYSLVKENEKKQHFELVVFSVYEAEAKEQAKKYNHTRFIFIKVPSIIQGIDRLMYKIFTDILKVKKNMSYRYMMQRIWYEWKVAHFLKQENFERVIVENTPASFLALKWKKNSQKYSGRYYYHLHNDIGNTFSCDNVIKNSESIICVSKYIQECFLVKYPDYDKKFHILMNCVISNNGDSCTHVDFRKLLGIKEEEYMVLFAGRISEEKGVMQLVEAFVQANLLDSKLVIVGGHFYNSDIISEYEKEVKEKARDFGDRIIFTGYIPYHMMQDVYDAADVAVFPSMWNEPAGLTIIEAMARGKAVITTYSGGIPEYVGAGNVILLKKNEMLIESIANALKHLYNDLQLRNALREKARKRAQSFSEEKYYEEFCHIMEE